MPARGSKLKRHTGSGAKEAPERSAPVRKRTLPRKIGPIWRALKPFYFRNRNLFFQGVFFAILLVAARIAMPWPLRRMMTPWLQSDTPSGDVAPALQIGVLYALLIIILGLADYRLRLSFARFSIAVVRDVRKRVLDGLSFLQLRHQNRSTGDLVTRLVGDSARLKAGLKGFLVHVATNGLMFLGISIVILCIDLGIGIIFLAASTCNIAITLIGAGRIFLLAIKQRRKETRLAESISNRNNLSELAAEDDDEDSVNFNRDSGTYEARITKLQGRVTWGAHCVLALALPFALWLGFQGVLEETLAPGDLFVVMIYALMIIGPMVRLTRQGARSGKILANANRLRALLRQTERQSSRGTEAWKIDENGIELRKVRLFSPPPESRLFFGPVSLRIGLGERIAVLGPPGSGTSTLLGILAGKEDYRGKICSGSAELRKQSPSSISGKISYSAAKDDYEWSCLSREELQLETPWIRRLFHKAGHRLLFKKLRQLPSDKVLAAELSPSERSFLSTLKALLAGAPLTLLDQPLMNSPGKSEAKSSIRTILSHLTGSQAILISLRKPCSLRKFDRIIVMRKGGRISFQGDFQSWQAWRSNQNRRTQKNDE